MGAPKGNQNAAKAKEWENALRYALVNYADKEREIPRGQALKAIARSVVELAIQGNKDAWQEIGNRLDGKPTQQTELTGANGGPVQAKVTVEFIKAS